MADRSVHISLQAKEKTRAAVNAAQGHLKALQRTAIVVSASIKASFAKAGAAINAFGRFAAGAMRQLRVGLLAAVGVGAGLLVFLNKAIKAAKEQELAERKLEGAFLGSGKATKAGIEELKKYADALQKTTGFADEQIINAQAMLATFQLTDKQVAAATPRLLDMAAAMQQLTGGQVDLQQIAIAVGKGLTGQVGILSRYGVVISDAVKESGDFNDILIELDKNFKGIAEVIGTGTYEGAIKGVSNAYDEMKEKIGAIITESDSFRGFLNTLREGFEKLTIIITDNTQVLRDLAENGLQNFVTFAAKAAKAGVVIKAIFGLLKGATDVLISSVKFAFDSFVKFFKLLETLPLVGKHIKTWRKDVVDGIGELGDALSGTDEKGGFIKGIKKDFEAIDKMSEKFSVKFAENTVKSADASKKLKERIADLKPVTEKAGEAAEKMSKKQIAALNKETEKAYASIANNIHDTVSNLLFTRLTQRGQEFRDTMVNIFRDIGDNIIRMFTNAAASATMNMLGISQMLAGIGGGGAVAGIVGAPRVVQTSAGGISNLGKNAPAVVSAASGRGAGGGQVSPAAAQLGLGVAVSGGQRLLAQPGISNLRNTLPVGIAAGQGVFSAGGIGSSASMSRLGFAGLGTVLRRLPFTPFPTLLGRTASNLIGRGSALISRASGLGGSIGGLLSSIVPLGGLGQGGFSGVGGAVGSIGGSLAGAALGGPVGAAIGAFGGGVLGRIGGGLLGRGGSNRNLNFGLGVPANLSRFGIPSQITARSFRTFGPQIVAAELGVQAARGDILKRAQALGFGNQPEIIEAGRETGVTFSPADAIAKIQASIDRLGIAEIVVQGVEKALENAVTNGLSAGFQAATATRGFELMINEMKSTIMENITSSLIAAITNTAAFKGVFAKTIVPVTTFLAGQEGKDVFDVEGFKNVVANVGKLPGLGESQKLFTSLFTGLKSLSDKLFGGETTAFGAAEAIRIPKLQYGGVITKSGLAFVDKGESFSGVGKSRRDLFDNSDGGNGAIFIDLKGASINLSSSQNISTVAQELGRRTRLEINKPRQFSKI